MRPVILLLIALAAVRCVRADLARPTSRPALVVAGTNLCESALAAETDLDPVTLAAAQRRFQSLADEIQSAGLMDLPPAEAARRLLEFLHARALRGQYRPEASRLSAALLNGDFNCLSATLLYAALAERVELPVVGAVWPAHVACVVLTATGPIDVEPTCREWFRTDDAQARHALRREALAAQGLRFEGVEPRRLDQRQLLALVYFNLGTEHLRCQQPAAATEALERAWTLDPASPVIEANLLAALNNQAVQLQRQGAPEAARELLDRCRRIAPHDALTAQNLARLGR